MTQEQVEASIAETKARIELLEAQAGMTRAVGFAHYALGVVLSVGSFWAVVNL